MAISFPPELFRQGRLNLPPHRIKSNHRMYIRHKPGYDWDETDNQPDYTKLRIDKQQSMYWNLFSIPVWARFSNSTVYLENYAVLSYLVKVIRNTSSYSHIIIDNPLDIVHKSESENYSHCEIVNVRILNKIEKREIRMTLKHKSIIHLKPNQEKSSIVYNVQRLALKRRQLLSKFI